MNHILHSDVMLAEGHGIAHPVGSRRHEVILKTFDRMIATLARQLDEREAQYRVQPHDTELGRRVGVLTRALGDTHTRRDHFAATGETLPMPGIAAGAVPQHPGTLYHCPLCKATDDSPGRFIRIDVPVHSAHFGKSIPCPQCRPNEYAAYVEEHGQPTGLPWPEVRGAA